MNTTMPQDIIAAAERFKAFHEHAALFVIYCAWDAFSALLFERSGVPCIGATSGSVN
ncbi:MAG: 2-methylisocitrate lyase-like PEP mutase family enzyme [bacterium]|jgi:2-methylisocitrate lyase-like PEP mutase family enzyme